jgi:hypothetical protein
MEREIDNNCVRILLISDCESSIGNVEQKLLRTMGMTCCVWHCSTLDESMGSLKVANLDVDVILVDHNLMNSNHPPDIFQRMGDVVDGVPTNAR